MSLPHGRCDSPSGSASASANDCAGGSRHKKTNPSTDTRADDGRAAAHPQRYDDGEDEPHAVSPKGKLWAAISNGW